MGGMTATKMEVFFQGYNDLLVLNVGNGWEWGNGIIITSDYGSFPHSLLSTSKMRIHQVFFL